MATRDEQQQAERAIFQLFVGAAGLSVDLASIESREPPEPDILCRVEGESPVAFELVEVVISEFAERLNQGYSVSLRFNAEYQKLPGGSRVTIEGRLGGYPAVLIGFLPGTPPGRWPQAIQPVLDTLVELGSALDAGEVPVWPIPRLRGLLTDMTIMRASGSRASLHVPEATELVDVAEDRLAAKFGKHYTATAPVELLAYYASEPPREDSKFLAGLQAYVSLKLPTSPFRRVWVFDCWHRRVLLVHPRLEAPA
jgi:hypothetical protein